MTSPLRGREDQPKGYATPKSLFSKMGDKGKGGIKNLKKMGDIIYGQPLRTTTSCIGAGYYFSCQFVLSSGATPMPKGCTMTSCPTTIN